jgi:NAD(P)-dependent dehydrogenase (short-subunit alcohol dehydrogenase family)
MAEGVALDGRVALVTGGGRGVGRAIALGLAEDGADVAIVYRKDADSAKQTVADIEALGRRAIAVAADVADLEDIQTAVQATVEVLGPISILINNAGLASRGQTVAKTDPAEVERLLRVHAIGPHWLCQAALPSMRECERGDIIFISSVATDHNAGGGAPYNMGKAAMEALAFTLAKEVRGKGVRVNIVAPGLVDTEMGRRLMKGAAGIDDIRTLDASSPFGRVCTPEDVASVVRFLVSDGGSYVTGVRVRVDGGGPG